MNVLGIETSCDETAASVIKDGRIVLANVVVSSLKKHCKYGGVIPEIASRRQMEFIYPVVVKALKEADLPLKKLDALAVTNRPGLIGSLLVGISFARSLAFALNKPLVEIDHIKAHLYACFLSCPAIGGMRQALPSARPHHRRGRASPQPTLPAVGLVVSGGHTSLYLVKSFTDFRLLGQTLDDAAGEAFDKVARILNLGYPGGPAIDHLAQKVRKTTLSFSCADLPGTWNFSFSGIKTAILYHKQKYKEGADYPAAEAAYAFQKSVVTVLVSKSLEACRKLNIETLLAGGGVAANSALRQRLQEAAIECGIKVFFPPPALCTDNAAMIAGMGFHYFPSLKKKRGGKRRILLDRTNPL
jgi:N6-L-threonylcarbamoyladenine synthase